MRVTAVRNGPATDTGDGTGPRTGPGHGRLVAVDAVRGLAVLGMFAVHVGPGPRPDGAGYLLVAADGRAPALFTPLAGFSLALAQRGRTPAQQPDGWALRYRPLLIRCAVLAGLGLLLAALRPGILVILAFFAVHFLAAEPFTRPSAPVLTAVAGVCVVAGPLLSFLLGRVFGYEASGRGAVPGATALTGLFVLAARSRAGARLLRPLTALGAMALSAYVLHALALAGPAHGAASWTALAGFAGVALVAAWAWQRFWADSPLRRGPLEHLLRLAAQGRPAA
ncbi:DUF418 domain-containing protein [Streptomyces sp. NBC_00320]|uniref:DUF418 domain-containing protein n=1 Tax=Streptomyces sp. NBC_00320 TaxID=2975711 RepID=UPI00224FD97F|nr:DUF418 domain-containing protein [Streptomyces sp. NBC_00320]MCX5149401.1 DUF418 domain-containing protein [Streptomyces sp. NBC_00320]